MSTPTITIVGANGRIGNMLGTMATQQKHAHQRVTRTDDPADLANPGPSGPIVLCIRNDAMDAILAQIHPSRHPDLVFVQNGVIQPWLTTHGLGGCTLGVLYVAVPTVAAPPIAGADSVFSGKWADVISALLNTGGVRTRSVSRDELHQEIAIKLAWICVFGLICTATQQKVGGAIDLHQEDIRALCAEIHPVLVRTLGLRLSPDALTERVVHYGTSIRHFPAGLKEWRWRNGWLTDAAASIDVDLPIHDAWLQRTRAVSAS